MLFDFEEDPPPNTPAGPMTAYELAIDLAQENDFRYDSDE